VAAHFVEKWRGRAFWAAVVVAEACIGVQILLGVTLLTQGRKPGNFHIFYGVLLVVAPTLAWVYRSEPAIRRRVYLWYGGASLFFMGLAIRAMLVVGRAT
jgi:hypothetical protein